MDTVIIAIPFFKTATPQLWIGSAGMCPAIDTLSSLEPQHPKLDGSRPVETFPYSGPIPTTPKGYSPTRLYIRYMPMVKRWSKWELVIEFSVTKLLLGNNLEELPSTDNSAQLTATLSDLLSRIGITVDFALYPAVYWSRADFSRNFLLTQSATNEMIRPLIFLSPGSAYQSFYEDYADGGFRDARYNKQRYSVIYDKVAEVTSYPARYKDLSRESAQYQISKRLSGSTSQILRIECRLNKAETINRELRPLLGHDQPYTFTEMMSPSTNQYVMQRYLERLTGKGRLKALLLLEVHGEDELARLFKISAHVHHRHYKPAWITYLKLITRMGEDDAAKEMAKQVSADTVRNYRKTIDEILTVMELEHPVWKEYLGVLGNISSYKALALQDVLPQNTCDSATLTD